MFDLLTTDDLYKLHEHLYDDATIVHRRILDGTRPVVPVFSAEWELATEIHNLIFDAMCAVDAELAARLANHAADA